MIHIYICEDSLPHRQMIEKDVAYGMSFSQLSMRMQKSSADPYELLSAISEGQEINIYFLDIDLKHSELNGLTLASKIREKDPFGFIIFITTHAEMSYLTFQYKVNAFDFIIKDEYDKWRGKIIECFQVIEERVKVLRRQKDEVFTLTIAGEVFTYATSDIILFETIGSHSLRLYCLLETIEFKGTLTQIEKDLPEDFFRSHRSYLLNLKQIKRASVGCAQVEMKNGLLADVAKPKRKILKEKLAQL